MNKIMCFALGFFIAAPILVTGLACIRMSGEMKDTSMANKLVDRSFPVDPEIAKARRDNLANSTRLFKKKQRGRQSSMLRRVLADAGYKSI